MQAFQPLTISDIAELLDVCERTIRNYVDQGNFPAPVTICGKKYWHPEVLYLWLDKTLRREPTAVSSQPLQRELDSPTATTKRTHSSTARAKAAQSERLSSIRGVPISDAA